MRSARDMRLSAEGTSLGTTERSASKFQLVFCALGAAEADPHHVVA